MAERPPATILFVDDDAANRQPLSWLFRHTGYRVLEAGTGEEALRLLEEKPDLVVLDINLPDISGFEVCRRIKAHPATRSISVLHVSAIFVGSGDRSQGLEGGADGYLVKPVEPRELLATVQALLRVRAAEAAARAAAQEWRSTFDAISDAVCLLDPHGRICRCNRALATLVRRDFPELLGRPLDDVLRIGLKLDHAPGIFALVREDESAPTRTASRESQELLLGGRWFRVTADPSYDEAGMRTGWVCLLTDVTQRKELEEQLRQSQRLEAIGRLAGGVAHDFNNLLTAVLGNASLLLRTLPEGEPEHHLVTTIERAAWRGAELVRQLLGFSRQTLLWLRPVDPGEIVDEVTGSLRRSLDPRIDLVVRREPALWTVQADPGQLGQALMNLCLRAVDAMPRGGRLTLTASCTQVDEEYARKHVEARPGPCVRISVHDTGESIPPEARDKIFDPFFAAPLGERSSPRATTGSGLGLAQVHGLIKQHQGWVECRSEPAMGTRFELYLPRTAEAVDLFPIPATVAGPAGKRLVLLADDNDTLRSLAAAYLKQGGFQVLLAGDGQEAVEVYQREQGRIDLVILDQTMPQMTGAEALRQIRTINPDVRALFASSTFEARGCPDEVLGVIPKPYRERELLQAVHGALELV
jgi:PAS domain S-box-containing protein